MDSFIAAALVVALLLSAAGYVGARHTLARGEPWIAKDGILGWDKLDHFVWSLALIVALAAFHVPTFQRWVVFGLVAVAVEVVELVRYGSWLEKGKPQPWPAMTDAVSWRDLLWDLAGGLTAAWFIARIG